jgi:hypothetical protein
MINANANPESQRMEITSDQALTNDDIRLLSVAIRQLSRKQGDPYGHSGTY